MADEQWISDGESFVSQKDMHARLVENWLTCNELASTEETDATLTLYSDQWIAQDIWDNLKLQEPKWNCRLLYECVKEFREDWLNPT